MRMHAICSDLPVHCCIGLPWEPRHFQSQTSLATLLQSREQRPSNMVCSTGTSDDLPSRQGGPFARITLVVGRRLVRCGLASPHNNTTTIPTGGGACEMMVAGVGAMIRDCVGPSRRPKRCLNFNSKRRCLTFRRHDIAPAALLLRLRPPGHSYALPSAPPNPVPPKLHIIILVLPLILILKPLLLLQLLFLPPPLCHSPAKPFLLPFLLPHVHIPSLHHINIHVHIPDAFPHRPSNHHPHMSPHAVLPAQQLADGRQQGAGVPAARTALRGQLDAAVDAVEGDAGDGGGEDGHVTVVLRGGLWQGSGREESTGRLNWRRNAWEEVVWSCLEGGQPRG